MGNGSSAEADVEPKVTGGKGPEAFLNVYEPTDESRRGMLGFGIYHSGIEISGVEYAYGGGSVSASGVYTQSPKTDPPGSQWKFKTSIRLGKITPTGGQFNTILNKLKNEYPANQYDVVGKNCNHFAEDFAKALGVEVNFPSWVNRAARYGGKLGYVFEQGTTLVDLTLRQGVEVCVKKPLTALQKVAYRGDMKGKKTVTRMRDGVDKGMEKATRRTKKWSEKMERKEKRAKERADKPLRRFPGPRHHRGPFRSDVGWDGNHNNEEKDISDKNSMLKEKGRKGVNRVIAPSGMLIEEILSSDSEDESRVDIDMEAEESMDDDVNGDVNDTDTMDNTMDNNADWEEEKDDQENPDEIPADASTSKRENEIAFYEQNAFLESTQESSARGLKSSTTDSVPSLSSFLGSFVAGCVTVTLTPVSDILTYSLGYFPSTPQTPVEPVVSELVIAAEKKDDNTEDSIADENTYETVVNNNMSLNNAGEIEDQNYTASTSRTRAENSNGGVSAWVAYVSTFASPSAVSAFVQQSRDGIITTFIPRWLQPRYGRPKNGFFGSITTHLE